MTLAHAQVSWTELAKTSLPGDNSITLVEPVSWPIGSKIVIATTNFESIISSHSEVFMHIYITMQHVPDACHSAQRGFMCVYAHVSLGITCGSSWPLASPELMASGSSARDKCSCVCART